MKTTDIVLEINRKFALTYKNAAKFVGSGPLWDFCIATIQDPIKLGQIVFANDMGIPPVKSLITMYERQMHPEHNFSPVESQNMGSLMGFVFKYVLNYHTQKERCVVNQLGVKSATRYCDGPIYEFEE